MVTECIYFGMTWCCDIHVCVYSGLQTKKKKCSFAMCLVEWVGILTIYFWTDAVRNHYKKFVASQGLTVEIYGIIHIYKTRGIKTTSCENHAINI